MTAHSRQLTIIWIVTILTVSPAGAWAAPSSDEWITINKDYSGQRYVDLDQITPAAT
jgi:hypothetical protein